MHLTKLSLPQRHVIALAVAASGLSVSGAHAQTSTVFLDTFGASTVRTTSPYVPQAYLPASDQQASSATFSHKGQFYKFGNLAAQPGDTAQEANNRGNIDNGYYAVGNPSILATGAQHAGEGWYWFKDLQLDYSGGPGGATPGEHGATLAMNAGVVLNEYYRRTMRLTPGASYELSAAFYISNSSMKSRFEIQQSATGTILAKTADFGDKESGSNQFPTKTWSVRSLQFTVPANCSTEENYSASLRNMSPANMDNDFYVDDVKLVRLNTAPAGAIMLTCPTKQVPSISATDDGIWTVYAGEASPDSVRKNDVITQPDGMTKTPTSSTNTSIRQTETVPGVILREDGFVEVAPGTPAGVYEIPYEICIKPETKPWPTCAAAVARVEVPPVPAPVRTPDLDPQPDDYTATPTAPGGKTPSVIHNDTSNTVPLTESDLTTTVTVTLVDVDPGDFTMDPTDGTITVGTNVPPGTYTLTYELCSAPAQVPANCKTTTATILVQPLIDAVDDDFSSAPTIPGKNTPSVLGNDTLDGAGNPTPKTDVVVGSDSKNLPPAGFTVNPDGTISVGTNVPPGTYPVPYQICAVATPTLCDTAVATVKVEPGVTPVPPTIAAANDDFTTAPTVPGKSTPSVLGNDKVNDSGNPTPVTDVIVSKIPGNEPPAGFTINPDGTITVDPSVTPGEYTVPYQICLADPAYTTTCATAVANIKVAPSGGGSLKPPVPAISATDDDLSSTPFVPGQTTPSIVGNDELNGLPPTPGTNITVGNDPAKAPPPGFTINPDGSVSVGTSVTPGTYEVPYQICAVSDAALCATAKVTITVGVPGTTPPTTGAHSVPTLGTWSLMLLSGLLGMFAMLRRRVK